MTIRILMSERRNVTELARSFTSLLDVRLNYSNLLLDLIRHVFVELYVDLILVLCKPILGTFQLMLAPGDDPAKL